MTAPDPGRPPRAYDSIQIPARGLGKVLRRLLDRLHDNRRASYPLFVARVLVQVVHKWARDRCLQQAASLAFQTALSLVPVCAVGLALLRATGAYDAQSALVEAFSRHVLPVSRDEIASRFLAWIENFNVASAGVVGMATMLVLSFVMFDSVEGIFNDIWRVHRRRSITQRFMVFWAIAPIVPALLGVSLYHIGRSGLAPGPLSALAALLATWAALFCANKLLPSTRVASKSAAVGALLSALAFEAAKHLFHLYVSRVVFQKYAGIYGALGLVPILLIWIYYTWLVLLLGAEVAYAMQHVTHLERLAPGGGEEPPSGALAARLMTCVVESWRRGQLLSKDTLAMRFGLPPEVVERVFRRLKQRSLVLEVEGEGESGGYVPARPPAEITLADVIAPFQAADASGQTALSRALSDAEQAARDQLGKTTLADVIEGTGEA